MGDFDRLDIVTLFRLARTINFIKGKMDLGELEEGIRWKEFFRVLKDKRNSKVQARTEIEDEADVEPGRENKVKGKDKVEFYGRCGKDGAFAWIDLLLLLFKERSFFSLIKDSGGRTYFLKEESSEKVLDSFFERAWERPILKSRHSVA